MLALDRTLPERAELFADHYGETTSLPQPEEAHMSTFPVFFSNINEDGTMDARFTIQELQALIQELQRKSAPACDRLTDQALKNLAEESFA